MTQTETAESTPLRSAERPQGLQGGAVGAKGEAPCVARPTTPTGGRECLNPTHSSPYLAVVLCCRGSAIYTAPTPRVCIAPPLRSVIMDGNMKGKSNTGANMKL